MLTPWRLEVTWRSPGPCCLCPYKHPSAAAHRGLQRHSERRRHLHLLDCEAHLGAQAQDNSHEKPATWCPAGRKARRLQPSHRAAAAAAASVAASAAAAPGNSCTCGHGGGRFRRGAARTSRSKYSHNTGKLPLAPVPAPTITMPTLVVRGPAHERSLHFPRLCWLWLCLPAPMSGAARTANPCTSATANAACQHAFSCACRKHAGLQP